MEIVSLLLRWSHILFAMILVGGLIFQRFVLLPAKNESGDAQTEAFHLALRSRWSKWVMLATGVLLLSGFINFFLVMGVFETPYQEMPSLYHMVFGIKFLLALAIFALAAILSGSREKTEKMRQQPKMWLNLSLAFALGVVICSGILRGTHSKPPIGDNDSPPVSTTSDAE